MASYCGRAGWGNDPGHWSPARHGAGVSTHPQASYVVALALTSRSVAGPAEVLSVLARDLQAPPDRVRTDLGGHVHMLSDQVFQPNVLGQPHRRYQPDVRH